MFIPDIKLIDKALVDAIENIFYITNSNEIYLERLVPILKLEFTKNDLIISYNNSIRNIHFYIKKNHGSISKFLKNYSQFKIDTINNKQLLTIISN